MSGSKMDTLITNLESVGVTRFQIIEQEQLNDVISDIVQNYGAVYQIKETELENSIHIPEEKLTSDCRIADVAIEEVFGAIAETGAIISVSAVNRNMEASLLPSHHVALVSKDRVFESLEDFFDQVDDQAPRNITLITGPSRTADIELTLTVGVHGPERLDVIVI